MRQKLEQKDKRERKDRGTQQFDKNKDDRYKHGI